MPHLPPDIQLWSIDSRLDLFRASKEKYQETGKDEWRGRKKGRERREEERRHRREGNMETQTDKQRQRC